ncbi:TPR-like protein [Serendipita vermifera]|nr:TPR-like protein [Serendipita vermifera]
MGLQLGHLGIYYRFRVADGLIFDPKDHNMYEKIKSSARNYIQEDGHGTRSILRRSVESLQLRICGSTVERLYRSGGGQFTSPGLPPLSNHFVMRRDPWDRIINTIMGQGDGEAQGQRIVVISGLAGCGKTQLAIKFAKEFGSRFASVFFTDGSSEVAYRADLVRHVRSLGQEHSQKSFNEALSFITQVSAGGEYLLIVDNVDDPGVNLEQLLPQCDHGAIIITTRNHLLGHLTVDGHLTLDSLSEEEGMELLVRTSRRPWPTEANDTEAMEKVCSELGHLPIALVQAGSYMAQTGINADLYIARLRENRQTILEHPAVGQRDMVRYKSAYAAFDASYKVLPQKEQQILQLLGVFHWSQFPSTHIDRNDVWNAAQWDTAIILLQKYSFISITPTATTSLINTHPLTHMWLNDRLISSTENLTFRVAAIRLLTSWDRNWHVDDQYLLTHVLTCLNSINDMDINDQIHLADLLQAGGQFHSSAKLEESILERLKETLGDRHQVTASVISELAYSYSRIDEHQKAEQLHREVVRVYKEEFGDSHSLTLRASSSLAACISTQGRYEEAVLLQEEILKLMKESIGIRNLSTIATSARLATTYSYLGRHDEAIRLREEEIQFKKEVLGENHLRFIIAIAGLARCYHQLGEYSRAEELHKEAFRLSKEVLGERHQHTIHVMVCWGMCCNAIGSYTQAEQVQQEALKLGKELLGETHSLVLLSTSQLAQSYYGLGQYKRAEQLQQDALKLKRGIKGETHHDTIKEVYRLACTREALHDHESALFGAREAKRLVETHLSRRPNWYNDCCQLIEHIEKRLHT